MMSWMNVMSMMTYVFVMNMMSRMADVLDECHFRDD